MEGPYRDLGSGFARLLGQEGTRRAPSPIQCVEDALYELLRNCRDAGARNIYVASVLRGRRYRTLTVIDDGCGIPEAYRDSIFEAGVTSRHLNPRYSPHDALHGAGLSLYHIKDSALSAAVLSTSEPTSIQATFDTHSTPERSLQSSSRYSGSNIQATITSFIENSPNPPNIYHSSPSKILATLLQNHIIQANENGAKGVKNAGERIGIRISLKTTRRISSGEIEAVRALEREGGKGHEQSTRGKVDSGGEGIRLGERERREVEEVIDRAARARYLEVFRVDFETLSDELVVRVKTRVPEDSYDE